MSRENMELYQSQLSAVRRGDWDAVAAHLDPDILVRTDPGWPEQRIYGRQAAVAWMREVTESVGADFHIDEIMDLGDRVLGRWCWKTRGEHSRIGGELHYSELITYRAGRAILIEHFREHDEALKAVGLEE